MRRLAVWVGLFWVAAQLGAQVAEPSKIGLDRHTIQGTLGFEGGTGRDLPAGWFGRPEGTVSVDDGVAHEGMRSLRLTRTSDSKSDFSSASVQVPLDFKGGEVELRGFLRLGDVRGSAGLWMREDADGQVMQFKNMESQQVQGTADWKEYTIKLPVDARATKLILGALVVGTGTVWADDMQLLVDGRPIADAPERTKEAPSILDEDHGFDEGSGVMLRALTPMQVENLAELGRVWGFLKYHDVRVTAGQKHWDYELFRVMPKVVAAKSRADAEAAMLGWIGGLGPIVDCTTCVQLDAKDLEVKPDLGWMDDRAVVGVELAQTLKRVYVNRQGGKQFYDSIGDGAKNAVFEHEPAYGSLTLPDAGFQMLGLFRLWNILQYWAPDREIAGQDWARLLTEFLPKVALAKDKTAYELAMMELIAKINDTHAGLWSAIQLRPPVGECALAVDTRFVGGEAVVYGYAGTKPDAAGLRQGDVVEALDGVEVKSLVTRWTPLYDDSNEAARLRDIGRVLTRGACGPVAVRVRREGKVLALRATRVPPTGLLYARTHDMPGEPFRMLSKDVAYLKLSSVKAADVAGYIAKAKATKGLVVDIRNYPSEFVVFALGDLLATKHTEFATFTMGDFANPGAFHFGDVEALDPAEPHYAGKVMVLVDEVTQSSAEYTAMALQSTPNVTVVGSTTAGADGNVSAIALPGGLTTMISGLGVYYPDKKTAQRVGVRIDVEVTPTVVGIRAGRDEVLEEAIRRIVGGGVGAAEVQEMARH